MAMTDKEVVDGAERMARVLLQAWGFEFSGEAVRKSANPRAVSAWSVVSSMLEEYNGTDLQSAVDSVDEDVNAAPDDASVTLDQRHLSTIQYLKRGACNCESHSDTAIIHEYGCRFRLLTEIETAMETYCAKA